MSEDRQIIEMNWLRGSFNFVEKQKSGLLRCILASIFVVILLVGSSCSFRSPEEATFQEPGGFLADLVATGRKELWLVTRDGEAMLAEVAEDGKLTRISVHLENVQRISFISQDQGWAVDRSGFIWATVNRGRDWIKLKQFSDRNAYGYAVSDFAFTDPYNGWIVDSFHLWRTVDGGNSWQVSYPTDRYNWGTLEAQPSAGNLEGGVFWLGLTNGQILVADSLTAEWRLLDLPQEMAPRAMHSKGKLSCIVAGTSHSGLFFTSDGGTSWVPSTNDGGGKLRVLSMSFTNPDVGWASGMFFDSETLGSKPAVLKTVDAGKTWRSIGPTIDDTEFTITEFFDETTGWASSKSRLYFSGDGGHSWKVVFGENESRPPNR